MQLRRPPEVAWMLEENVPSLAFVDQRLSDGLAPQ
jgi:hypothetical protein